MAKYAFGLMLIVFFLYVVGGAYAYMTTAPEGQDVIEGFQWIMHWTLTAPLNLLNSLNGGIMGAICGLCTLPFLGLLAFITIWSIMS